MSEKLFKETFQGIRLEGEADSYFDDVKVTGVTFWRGSGKAEIGILSRHLIPKSIVFSCQEQLKQYLFGDNPRASVEITEKYILSSQYTLPNLLDAYWDSFLAEIREHSYVDYKLLVSEPYKVSDGTIFLTISDGILARSRKPLIEKYFVEVLEHRFGMTVSCLVKLVEKKNSGQEMAAKQANDEARKAIEAISANVVDEEPARREAAASAVQGYDADKNEVVLDTSVMKAVTAKPEEKKKVDYKANLSMYHNKNYEDLDCFYGKNTEGDITPISSINAESMGEYVFHGKIFGVEERQTRKGDKWIVNANITDFTDSIGFKLFIRNEDHDPVMEKLCNGAFVRLKGTVDYDDYAHTIMVRSVNGLKTIPDFRKPRLDEAQEKRTELHLHTVMSEKDSVCQIGDLMKTVLKWGWKTVAITDHGVAQGFPIAFHWLEDNKKTLPEGFKLIYGMEAYLVDDLKTLIMNPHGQSLESEYVVFDIETTGLSFSKCKIIEIGAVRINKEGKEIDRFSEFVNPGVPIPYNIEKLTSISDETVKDADPIEVVLPKFLEFCKGAMLVAHNATFDTTFIRVVSHQLGLEYDFTAFDTMTIAYIFLPELGRYNLDRLTNYFKLKNAHHHRACDDADVTAKIFMKLMELVKKSGARTVDDLNKMNEASPDAIRKAKPYHASILIQNETGRVNLYRLISEAHVTYFNRVPKIPMSLLQKYRDGLLVGSACQSGQLFQNLLQGAEEEDIERIIRFYDYLEIMPCGNNKNLISDDKAAGIDSVEDLQDLNRKIIELGAKFDKTVVATGDVHFLNPEDAIYRSIVYEGKDGKITNKEKLEAKAEEERKFEEQGLDSVHIEMLKQPPLYLHTTEEMLKEFEYLGPDMAKKVVIDNPNMIADMIDEIEPVRPDKCPPIIENSDQILRDICNDKAHEIYGPKLPKIVEDRLDKELDSIIGNGYSVMYVIAQKLVWRSNDDGYLVGSRGSVGSSFAATMAGITEVNPLPPHYLCPECYWVDFDSEEVLSYSGMMGWDMPDKNCPKCGHKLLKNGTDIPFETFLGFKGDKEPDIDLNFSGEYQPRAHAFIEEIFGKGKAFRAGTIGTLADKTCYGYALRYCENRNISKRSAELIRLSEGCVGVKNTTGQHPGGMIVLPPDEDIYSFTPIQKPANDMTTPIITTHFEYHSIQQNLLKFDILGHDDPTMIRRLEDLTGLVATEIPLDDKNVMEMFQNTKPLGVTPEQLHGVHKSTLGIPEFGTDFAMQMLEDAAPVSFSDLVRISGLSHGTDVWLGNAETLIKEGVCKLASAICCRDDIMVYLIHMGMEPGEAFTIMERVRKGIVAKGKCKEWPQYKEDMLAHNVPEWYIGSCEKIKYMFPKAHAVAYVMMAWRVAWFKLYHPLAYYAAFFSIRAKAFNYEIMCQGEPHLEQTLKVLRSMDKNAMSANEQNLLRDCRLVEEMYERGLEFMPIDIYRADATRFQIMDGKIMPSLTSIDGMGENAAKQLQEAAKKGEFLSQQEIKDRAKISGTVLAKMSDMGILGDLPQTSQLTFDFLK